MSHTHGDAVTHRPSDCEPHGAIERASQFTALGAPARGRLVHGFTTRIGGVSEGPFASLNMTDKRGDDPRAVAANRAAVAAWAGCSGIPVRQAVQVHGAAVVSAAAVAQAEAHAQRLEADAVWGPCEPGVVVGVITADCVPVLLVDRGFTVVAAVHAGWRGVVSGVIGATVEALREHAGVAASQLVAAIGPCIEQAAFEVGPEVAERFDPAYVRVGPRGRPHVDLVGAARRELCALGLANEAIERVGGCTFAHPDRYFSYRRDGRGGAAPTGQQLAFIGVA